MSAVQKRKLIEVALPLEVINRESAREKSIRYGHPSTLHLWWARRPLAAARAVLFAQLVDDPSSLPEQFPTEALQKAERERLHGIIERLVVWENIRDERLLAEARAEIMKSCDGKPPPILDPFAGGGTIPLEAQRLGLEAHASDLNPVAVLINKALIEIPPKFRDRPPVFPDLADSQIGIWEGARGLAADVLAYGEWMRDQAQDRIGHMYPKATLPSGDKAKVIAWIWARTVTCPNPACALEMPLVRSWWLGKKKGKEAYVVPTVVDDKNRPSGKRVEFVIGHALTSAPNASNDGTVGRTGAVCVSCRAGVDLKYVRAAGSAGLLGAQLMAVVTEGDRRRVYVAPTPELENSAHVVRPKRAPDGELDYDPRAITTPNYGMSRFADLFTARQLTALTLFSDLVDEARDQVLKDSLSVGMPEGDRLESGGSGAEAYADAVQTYLGLAVSRLASTNSALCRWNSATSKESVSDTFARQALSMVWDYAEGNPFVPGPCELGWSAGWVSRAVAGVPVDSQGTAEQADASKRDYVGYLVSTDPPYYDNVPYSALSDFFYVWLRRSLGETHPGLLSTLLGPKVEELVANPYRHDGKDGAKQFFENGFRQVFARARESAIDGFPITVYYAFKQSESGQDGEGSSGWETLLEGMISSGWAITATWPLRTERTGRMRDVDSNALASSIVLALRPRPQNARATDRRGFIAALRAELPLTLRDLQQGAIAPVDLDQASIGPGMAVFSRYSSVVEPDGSSMSVGSAYARISEVRDDVLSEFEGDFDPTTRFAIAWYRQNGYNTGQFGAADNLARGRNTSVDTLARDEILTSAAGKVALLKPVDLPSDYDVTTDDHTSAWEAAHHLIRVLECDGVALAGDFLRAATSRPDGGVEAELVKELAFLLFSLAEKSGWTRDALSFNNLATSWPEIVEAARASRDSTGQQGALDFDDEEN